MRLCHLYGQSDLIEPRKPRRLICMVCHRPKKPVDEYVDEVNAIYTVEYTINREGDLANDLTPVPFTLLSIFWFKM